MLVWTEFLTDTVDKQFDSSAPGTHIDVKVLLILEQGAEFAKDTPSRPFVEFLGASILQHSVTTRAPHRIGLASIHE